ncbi:putative transcriptional regulator [Paenibacillus jamilae]|nr:putative transcriptional regulator [Paenibacillus jamilae]
MNKSNMDKNNNPKQKRNKQSIHLPTSTVRDPNINANDFCLILYLKYLTWRSGNRYEFDVSLSELKQFLNIQDNKTLKSSFNNIFREEYIIREIKKILPNSPIRFFLNQKKFDTDSKLDEKFFTYLPINILYGMKDRKLDRKEVRILYYIKSYINYSDPKKEYCFTGIEKTMVKELNMGKNTIPKYTDMLVKKNLIRIEKNKLETSYQYDEEGNLIFTRYNNHYYLDFNNIDKL